MKTKKKSKFMIDRAPVVAVMGHVDHGKTSLLDAIRGTSVQAGEVGGITQNTRAHEVTFHDQKITFIDTPGHEAFSQMRERGASVTDIVLLVVAADDGVQPQTVESIKFALKSKTPILVAINKIDAPGADIAKIKNQLSQNNVLVEEYGGDVQVYEVSALKKQGIDELLEGILLQTEILEIKKRKPKFGTADAVVLESKSDNKLGAIALILMKSGSIKVGDHLISTKAVVNVRAILSENMKNLELAEESSPVWVLGIDEVLPTGEILYFSPDEKEAKHIFKSHEKIEIEEQKAVFEPDSSDEASDDMQLLASIISSERRNDEIKKLNIVIRTDTQGTLDAVLSELEKLNNDDVEVNILSKGTGNITRKDIVTAKAARGIVLGFQVVVPTDLATIVKQERVLVRIYSVIYDLIDEVHDAMDGMLEPEQSEEDIARAHVKKVFVLSNGSKVAGCVVAEGIVVKGYRVRVERGDEEVGRGKIVSLKRNKEEVKEVQKNIECGIMIEPNVDIEEEDDIILYKIVTG